MVSRIETFYQLFLALPCALLLGACGTPSNGAIEHVRRGAGSDLIGFRIAQREKAMQKQWRGQTFSSLVGVLGEPKVVMSVPGRSAQSMATVYGVLDEEAQCIDAFTVVTFTGEAIVADYFCR